jgi:hypothetical protein
MPTNIKTGTVTGTGASLNVSVGFAPDYVKVWNDTAGDQLEWASNMTAGHAFKRVAAGTGTKITTGGISLFTGSATQQAGFTIGNDAVNGAAVTLRYLAVANGPGGM